MNAKYNCDISIEKDATRRFAAIRPRGFWACDMISVCQYFEFSQDKWGSPVVKWGSGGSNNELSSIDTAESFVNGLSEALKIAKSWDLDTGK